MSRSMRRRLGAHASQPDFARERERMVKHQLAWRGVRDRRVLDAMGRVPREAFVLDHLRDVAYDDGPLPIGQGQTISQPLVVAEMLQAAEIRPTNRVLDVGTGSGYAAAVASRLAAHVYTVERHAMLVDTANRRFDEVGYRNTTVNLME